MNRKEIVEYLKEHPASTLIATSGASGRHYWWIRGGKDIKVGGRSANAATSELDLVEHTWRARTYRYPIQPMDSYAVDGLITARGDHDGSGLLDWALPGVREELGRLDKQLRKQLAKIHEKFPDAEYYTAGGGFCLVLGRTHDEGKTASRLVDSAPQQQRVAWTGNTVIGDDAW